MNISEEKKFYILVTVYMAEKYIDACIQSVLKQTYGNFQLILLDDGTPDNSGRICDSYAQKDCRIHVIHKENRGQVLARAAVAKYVLEQFDLSNAIIVYLDSDDSLKQYALQKLLYTFNQEKCDMVVYGAEVVNDGKIIRVLGGNYNYIGTITDKRELYQIVFCSGAYNPLWRKAILGKFLTDKNYGNISHVDHGGDLLQSISYYEKCQKVVFIKDILYEYTLNVGSITGKRMLYENYKIDSSANYMVWKFLKDQKVWNPEDYVRYLCHMRTEMRIEVNKIAHMQTNMKNKENLFDKMRKDAYYSMLLDSTTYHDHLLNLLKKRRYRVLCCGAYIRSILSTLYHWIRKDI